MSKATICIIPAHRRRADKFVVTNGAGTPGSDNLRAAHPPKGMPSMYADSAIRTLTLWNASRAA